MKKLMVLGTSLVLSGCQGRQAIDQIPLYVNLGATVLRTELESGVTKLSDEKLKEYARIMATVVVTTNQIDDLAASYKAALDAEIARRGI
jgi:hypothetical protein